MLLKLCMSVLRLHFIIFMSSQFNVLIDCSCVVHVAFPSIKVLLITMLDYWPLPVLDYQQGKWKGKYEVSMDSIHLYNSSHTATEQ